MKILTSHIDKQKFVDTLMSRAQPKSVGYCARYVRIAMQAAGVVFTAHPASAYMYADIFAEETILYKHIHYIPTDYVPQLGDIVVWGNSAKHVHGHIQAYTPKGWVSDFVQRTIYPHSLKGAEWLVNGLTIVRL